MKLLMVSGDRSLLRLRQGPFMTLLEEFRHHFDRIDVLCPQDPMGDGPKRDWSFSLFENVWVHPSIVTRGEHAAWISRRGTELVREFGHDVMTVHEYPPFLNGIGARAIRKKTGIPAALEIHHIVGSPIAANLTELIGFVLSRLYLARHASHFSAVRTVNETVKNRLVSWGVPAERISVVPSVYLDHTLIAAVKDSKKRYDFVFCARLVPNKGLLETIDAIAQIPDATLLIVGDGPMKQMAEHQVHRRGLQSRITCTGWLPTAHDVLAAVACGRLFIMNSKSEGNPRSAIEAMALGVPVLATRVGIMPDIIKDGVNGVFTDGTAKDIAAKAQALFSDEKKLKLMGIEASKIAGRFEKKAAIKAYADFLKGLVHSVVETLRGSV